MIIQEDDFKLTSVSDSSPLFDLELLKIVNKGKNNEKKEFQNAGYGLPLESAIKKIATYRLNNKLGDDPIGLKVYIEAYKEIVNEIKKLCQL